MKQCNLKVNNEAIKHFFFLQILHMRFSELFGTSTKNKFIVCIEKTINNYKYEKNNRFIASINIK